MGPITTSGERCRGRTLTDSGAYANGWAQAEDRLFEMEVLRRAATGRLAALLGPSYLLIDQVARRDGFTRDEIEGPVVRRQRRASTAPGPPR